MAVLCGCSHKPAEPEGDMPPVKSDTLSNQFVHDIAEDSDGQIWIGTFRGLNRYNSREFYQYFEGEDSLSLPNNNISDILVGADGTVYVATAAGMCLLTERDDFRTIPLGTKCVVTGLVEMADSTVVAVTADGLMAYSPRTGVVERLADDACPGSMYAVRAHVNDRDELWIAGENSVRRYDRQLHRLADSVPTGGFATGRS